MGTDMMMINADSDTIETSKRAWAFTVVTALMLVLWLAVIAVTPANSSADSADISTTPAAVQPAHESSSNESSLGRGSSIDDPVTSGVDMHG
jgi:NADH:ubiquinone oxidoreductase subunit 6 (subunit J)